MQVMSVAEMKKEIHSKLDLIEDQQTLIKVLDILDKKPSFPTIDEMYKEAVDQYSDTLRKLAQ